MHIHPDPDQYRMIRNAVPPELDRKNFMCSI